MFRLILTSEEFKMSQQLGVTASIRVGETNEPINVKMNILDYASASEVEKRLMDQNMNIVWPHGFKCTGIFIYESEDGSFKNEYRKSQYSPYITNRNYNTQFINEKFDVFPVQTDSDVFLNFNGPVGKILTNKIKLIPSELGKSVRSSFDQTTLFNSSGVFHYHNNPLFEDVVFPVEKEMSLVVRPLDDKKTKRFNITHIAFDLFTDKNYYNIFSDEELQQTARPKIYGKLETPIEYTSSDYVYINIKLRSVTTIKHNCFNVTLNGFEGPVDFTFFSYFDSYLTSDLTSNMFKEAYPEINFGKAFTGTYPSKVADSSSNDRGYVVRDPLSVIFGLRDFSLVMPVSSPSTIAQAVYINGTDGDDVCWFKGFDQWGYKHQNTFISEIINAGITSMTPEKYAEVFRNCNMRSEFSATTYNGLGGSEKEASIRVGETMWNDNPIHTIKVIEYRDRASSNDKFEITPPYILQGFSLTPLAKNNKGYIDFNFKFPKLNEEDLPRNLTEEEEKEYFDD